MKSRLLLCAAAVVMAFASGCASGPAKVTERQTITVKDQQPIVASDQELAPKKK